MSPLRTHVPNKQQFIERHGCFPRDAGTHHIQIEYSWVPSSPDTPFALREPMSELFPGGPCVAFGACAADISSTVDRAGVCWRHGRKHKSWLEKDQCIWIRGSESGQCVYPAANCDHAQRSEGSVWTSKRAAYQAVQLAECAIPTMLCPRKRGNDKKALR